MALARATVLASSRSQTAQLTVLVHSLADPVDARIAANGLVGRVNQDDLVELVGRVLAHPVRVEHTQSTALAADTLLFLSIRHQFRKLHNSNLGNGAMAALVLQRVHTMRLGLAVGLTLDDGALAATALHTDTVDDKALLGLKEHEKT